MKATEVVVDVTLDEETVDDIVTIRDLQIEHYSILLNDIDMAAETLRKAGFEDEIDQDLLKALIMEKLAAATSRQKLGDEKIAADELTDYVSFLPKTAVK